MLNAVLARGQRVDWQSRIVEVQNANSDTILLLMHLLQMSNNPLNQLLFGWFTLQCIVLDCLT